MTTHSTADRTLLRRVDSGSGAGSARARSAGGALRGDDGSIGGPRVQPGCRQQSASGAAISRQEATRSEEHTSELQSLAYLVCRLLLEKKKKYKQTDQPIRQ